MDRTSTRLTLACLAVCALSACEQSEASPPATPDPPRVGFITVAPEALSVMAELPGRIAATRVAEVRPRVSGIVVEQVFEQGALVQRGDILYRIEAAPFEVALDSAEAVLRRAEAAQLEARQNSDRQEQLRKSNVTTRQDYDSSVARLAQADADVAAARAGVASAELDLQYTEITAPIAGRIGRALITEGALVTANSTESLATIQQLDPIYADFTQPAADLIRLRRALADGRMTSPSDSARVELHLDDGSKYSEPGKLLFSEATVDQGTGQLLLRGQFPNPSGELMPGMFVRVEIVQGVQNEGLAVPQQALQRNPTGDANLLVIGSENRIETRSVRLGRAVGNRWVIDEGINAGDRIVVDGFQRARQGAVVRPEPWSVPSLAAARVSGGQPEADLPAPGRTVQ